MKNGNKKNRGFSLIELIVVVAIMAVLVGVMAPAYLRYVEKARRQTCYSNMDNVVREVQLLAYSDPDFMERLAEEATAADKDLKEFVDAETEVDIPTCPSRGEYKLTFDKNEGVITMTCSMEVHGLPSEGEIGGEGAGGDETP